MTTRAQLESEREALQRCLTRASSRASRLEAESYELPARQALTDSLAAQFRAEAAALTASIARVDALLSLSDEDCRYMSDELLPTAPPAWHVVANIVRREPSPTKVRGTATFAPGWTTGDECEADVFVVGWRRGTIVGFEAPNTICVELPAGDIGRFAPEKVRRAGIPASAQSGHLDGGARALDASEARQHVCADCGRPAACLGRYEGMTEEAYACDICCGHGNEDGRCRPVEPGWDASEALREAHRAGYLAGYRSAAADAAADEHEVRDPAEALREARVQGMREAMEIVRVNTWIDAACTDISRAIEAVWKGER